MADQAQGSESRIIFGECSAYGEMPTTPNGILLYKKGGETFAGDIDQVTDETMRPGNRNATATTDGDLKQVGGFPFNLAWQYALLFKHLLGGYTPAAAVGGVYTEVFTVGQIPKAGLWAEKGLPDLAPPLYIPSVGHKNGKFSYELKTSGPVSCSFDMPGSKELPPSDTSVDATAIDLGYDPFNASLATIKLDGEEVANITTIKFDYDNSLDSGNRCIGGGGALRSLPAGITAITGNFSYLFEDPAIYNKAAARTIVGILLEHKNGSGAGTAGNEYMSIEFPEVKLAKKTPTIKDAKGVVGEAPFTAFYKSNTEASAAVFTIKHASTVLHTLLAGA